MFILCLMNIYPSGISLYLKVKLTTASVGETFIRDLPNSNLIFRVAKVAEVTKSSEVIVEKCTTHLTFMKNLLKTNQVESWQPTPLKSN